MMVPSATIPPDRVEMLSDILHTLAQPLTALSFVVDLALLQHSPDAWKVALENARVETRRAIAALNEARTAATALQEHEVPTWQPVQ